MKKRVIRQLLLLPVIIFCLIAPKAVSAEIASFSVNKDTYANAAYPDKVNGGFGSVTLSNKHTDRLGYLQFENIELPENAVFYQAILKFYAHELHYADTAKLNVGPVTGDWEENSLTWNNKPTIDQSKATETEISLTDQGWKEVTVTNLVRQWLEGDLENKGLFIYPFGFLYGTPETEFAVSFKSKESGENTARLEIEYHFESTPTPEESPTPTPEETLSPTPIEVKKVLIGGLCLVLATVSGIAFTLSFLQKRKKKEVEKSGQT